MAVQIRQVRIFPELEKLKTVWNSVASNTPFSSWQWLVTWAENYIREDQLYILVAETSGGGIVGILPLFRDRSVVEGRVLRMLGSGNVCTDYLSLFSLPEYRHEVCQQFALYLTAMVNDHAAGWDALLLEHIAQADTNVCEFTDSMRLHGSELMKTQGQNCWRIAIPDSWEKYLAEMSKSHRKQVKRIERELIETGKARLHTVESETQLKQAMELLVDLHQKRRNRLGQIGCFACERFSNFLFMASQRLLEAGMLRLHWVEVAGRPVAAEFQLSDGQTTYAYQAGIDPESLELEPGRLIMIATIRQALEAGNRGFDFLRGDEPYKAHFRAKPQPTTTWRMIAPSQRAQVHRTLLSASNRVKRWLKRGRELVMNVDR